MQTFSVRKNQLVFRPKTRAGHLPGLPAGGAERQHRAEGEAEGKQQAGGGGGGADDERAVQEAVQGSAGNQLFHRQLLGRGQGKEKGRGEAVESARKHVLKAAGW